MNERLLAISKTTIILPGTNGIRSIPENTKSHVNPMVKRSVENTSLF